ncbi:hypothetical protein D0U04_18890 [Bacillus clarus]|uniref:Uncharacterized protein n=1 Tax=Bacillus clarus TaxID=2338372 RepID=A0ABX9KSI0_9BACI|nr:hypothetical protein D0U04_18890 [Bacillus clarus]
MFAVHILFVSSQILLPCNSIVTNFFAEGNDETKVNKRSNHFVRKKAYFSYSTKIYLFLILFTAFLYMTLTFPIAVLSQLAIHLQ